jgi:hypothetical protein
MIPPFDENGNVPKIDRTGIIKSDHVEFEHIFVKNFKNSKTRSKIFREYLGHCEHLNQFKVAILQWVGGSFTTNKEHPNDIDFVTHFNGHKLDSLDEESQKTFDNFRKNCKVSSNNLCDSFFIPIYYDFVNESEFVDELTQFSLELVQLYKRRYGFDRNKNPRAIIELNFESLVGFDDIYRRYK